MKMTNFECRMPNVLMLIGVMCLLLSGSAFGYSLTEAGSAELGSSESVFNCTEYSSISDAVLLRSTGETKWTPASGITVRATTVDADSVSVVTNGNGGAIFTWKEAMYPTRSRFLSAWYDTNGNVIAFSPEAYPILVRTDEAVRLIKSTNNGVIDGAIAAFTHVTDIGESNIYAIKADGAGNGIWIAVVCTSEGVQHKPKLVSDNAGGAYVVWKDYRSNYPAIVAQKLNSFGTPEWTTNGVTIETGQTGYDKNPIDIVYLGSTGVAVGWVDNDNSAGTEWLFARLVSPSGIVHGGISGAAVSTLTGQKNNERMIANAGRDAAIFGWTEGSEPATDVYVQKMQISGSDLQPMWGSSSTVGLPIDVRSGLHRSGTILAHPNGDTTISWYGMGAVTFEGFIQRVSSAGAPLLGTGGVSLGEMFIFAAVTNEVDGLYGFAVTSGGSPFAVGGQSLSATAQKLWGERGVAIASYPIDMESFGNIITNAQSGGKGEIIAWADLRSGRNGIYAQKIEDAYCPTGTFISKKWQNPDSRFYSWGTAVWSVSGSGTIAVELKTAASEIALASATWTAVAYDGNIQNNGKWIQARVTFNRGSGDTTAALSSLTFNYAIDSSLPTISPPEIDGVKLVVGENYPVNSNPSITVTATDDVSVSSIKVEVDGTPVSATIINQQNRALVKAQQTVTVHPSISLGQHALKIEAIDEAGNASTATYNIIRSESAGITGGIARATAAIPSQGQSAAIAYMLNASSNIIIEIRDITGTLVQRINCPAGTSGALTGYNEVAWDGKNQAGEVVARGVYPFVIVSTGRQLASGKIQVK